ncbi:MAG: hypothetical protein J6J44_04320 [Lachnospiraceae bacterium]|nr:hypothetical protein [Lachnospiraceae bacterium]
MGENSKRKKLVLWGTRILCLVALLLFAGCGKDEIPIEDYVPSNPGTRTMNPIMKSDTGYYYCAINRRPLNLHYFDMESGQNIFLCSKPECRHDGDVFCTATSGKYTVRGACYYGGSLYINAVEETDNEYLCKLLKVSEDGTELEEVVTYQAVNSTSLWVSSSEPMLIHRGVAVLPYYMRSNTEESVSVEGICLYDLNTEELVLLPETGEDSQRAAYGSITAYGDYIYYAVKQGRRYGLNRYSLTNKTEETLELANAFTGDYVVVDDNLLFYDYGGKNLYEYHAQDKKNVTHSYFYDKMDITSPFLMTDGTYLYVGEGVTFQSFSTGYLGVLVSHDGTETEVPSYVHVFDRELNPVAKVEIATENYMEEAVSFSLAILDGTVYLKTYEAVFSCTLQEFLANEIPPFKRLYDHIDIEF